MVYNDPKKLLEIYFRINKSDNYSLQFPIQIFEYIFGADFLLETIAKLSFDDLNINKKVFKNKKMYFKIQFVLCVVFYYYF